MQARVAASPAPDAEQRSVPERPRRPQPDPGSWRYPETGDNRDRRLDLMRGFAMCGLVAVHVEVFSLLNLVYWEGLGFVTSAELFVVTSGLVLGLVQRRVVAKRGVAASLDRLLARAFELYRAYVVLILLVALVAATGLLDLRSLTTFTDWGARQTYPLYPPPGTPWFQVLGAALLLRATPHQVQVLGLYVCLIALTPLALWLLSRRLLGVYLALSWGAYFAYWEAPPKMVTGAQFEYAFPLVVWQLLFFHALAVGYLRPEIARWLGAAAWRRRLAVAASALLSLGFLLLSHSNPWAAFPAWYRLSLVPPDVFERWQRLYFLKNEQGILRVANIAAFFAALYALLTYCWRPIERALGWLLIPIGQASLYVFLLHVAFIAAIDNVTGGLLLREPVYDPRTLLPYTLLHLGVILGLWLLVRGRVLFSVIPR
jgi:hypothetical protein